MKINLKDYQTVDPNLENQDGLNKEWNDLSEIYAQKDDLQNLKLNYSLLKTETDTLLTTYDLLSKNILKKHKIKPLEDIDFNLDLITPCINIFEKALKSMKFLKETVNKKHIFFVNIKFLNVSFTHSCLLDYEISEQEIKTDFYEISLKTEGNNFVTFEHWQKAYLTKLGEIVCKADIKKNLYYINLYVSRIYIKKLRENGVLINIGKILEDGYGVDVIVVKNENIFKIKRKKNYFEMYKNEKMIECL